MLTTLASGSLRAPRRLQPRPRRSTARLGLLVLGLALALPHSGLSNAPADPLTLLPTGLREQGRALLQEPDEAQRAERVRALAGTPGSLGFLLALLERETSPYVRERLVSAISADRGSAARAALERVASSDPDVNVVLRALDSLHEIDATRLVELLETRMAVPSAEPQARDRLRAAHDHWLTVALGGMLPGFMRQAPPTFAAAPADRTVRVAAFGDFGKAEAPYQRQVADALWRVHQQRALDLGITLGDNFYPEGMTSPADPRWSTLWTEMYERLGIVFYATLGNHDWSDPDSPAAEVLFSAHSRSWRLPAARYTFTAGPAQFFALDTQALSAASLAWLDAELGASRARWKIVYGHHPIRSAGMHGDTPGLAAKLLPVLAGRAHVYLAGHDHDMQQLAAESGVHFFVSGSGGAEPRPVKPGNRALFATARNGFALLEIAPDQLRVDFVASNLEVLHTYTIR